MSHPGPIQLLPPLMGGVVTCANIDMSYVPAVEWKRGEDGRIHEVLVDVSWGAERRAKMTSENASLTPKQIRARARRRVRVGDKLSQEGYELMGIKPVEEWDMEELAKGVPRGPDGRFPRGAKTKLMDRAVHDRAMELFRQEVKGSLNSHAVTALKVIGHVLADTDVDDKGRPVTPPSVKLQAATMLVEHVVGKPTQKMETDISVKLQGILGAVMVNPQDMGASTAGVGGMKALPTGYDYAHRGSRGDIIDVEVVNDDDLGGDD